MSKEFRDVIEFNQDIINLAPTDYLSEERLNWFKNVINEELSEFESANDKYAVAAKNDFNEDSLLELKADMIDAIMDLLYFAYGRLYEIGCTEDDFNCMWAAIQNANMSKKRGNKGRGSDDDAIKPEGWQGPEKTFIEYRKGLKKQLDTCEQTITDGEQLSLFSEIIASNSVPATVTQPHTPGLKYDDGKPNLSLVFGGFYKALLAVGYIGTFGAKKYTPNGWKEVDNARERYESALLRHSLAAVGANPFDNESGHLHLAHAAWNALALFELYFMNCPAGEFNNYIESCKNFETNYFNTKGKNNG